MSQSWTHRRVASPNKMTPRVRQRLDSLDIQTFPHDDPYDKNGAYWWITRMEGKDVAFAGLKRVPGETTTGFMCRAGVIPEARGRKIHKELIEVRVRSAWRVGCKHLITYTGLNNPASTNNLLACGFKLYHPDWYWADQHSIYLRMDR